MRDGQVQLHVVRIALEPVIRARAIHDETVTGTRGDGPAVHLVIERAPQRVQDEDVPRFRIEPVQMDARAIGETSHGQAPCTGTDHGGIGA